MASTVLIALSCKPRRIMQGQMCWPITKVQSPKLFIKVIIKVIPLENYRGGHKFCALFLYHSPLIRHSVTTGEGRRMREGLWVCECRCLIENRRRQHVACMSHGRLHLILYQVPVCAAELPQPTSKSSSCKGRTSHFQFKLFKVDHIVRNLQETKFWFKTKWAFLIFLLLKQNCMEFFCYGSLASEVELHGK